MSPLPNSRVVDYIISFIGSPTRRTIILPLKRFDFEVIMDSRAYKRVEAKLKFSFWKYKNSELKSNFRTVNFATRIPQGLLTSKMFNHTNDRRNWEVRLAMRVAEFNETIIKLQDE